MFYLKVADLNERTALLEHFRSNDILAVFHYVPLHSSPMGREVGLTRGDLCNTEDLSDRLVRLPLWLGIEDELHTVIEKIVDSVS